MTTPKELLKETLFKLSELEARRIACRQQIEAAKAVQTNYQSANSELVAVKEERRGILAMLHLGRGKPDTALVTKAVHSAAQRVEAMRDALDGAEAARELLERDLVDIGQEVYELSLTLPQLRYEAALEEAGSIFDAYSEATDELQQKLAEVGGALMTLETLRPDNQPVRAWLHSYSLQMDVPDFPLLTSKGHKGLRTHVGVLPAANDAKVAFADRLARIGIA